MEGNGITMRAQRADIDDVLIRGQSGSYPHALLTPEDLLELSKLCLRDQKVIHTAEAYVLSPESEQLAMEFSLLNDPSDGWAPTWAERAQRSYREIGDLLAKVQAQTRAIGFQVWLDWETKENGSR